MAKLILVRHGESTWNKENRFTGWTNVPLTDRGVEQAQQGGVALRNAHIHIDYAFTSYLVRAQETLKEMIVNAPVTQAWQLNERHYGALQGLNKQETAKEHGEDQVLLWRRSYDIRPPALNQDDTRHPKNNPLYADVDPELLPATECLKDTVARTWPYYKEHIQPLLMQGKNVLIVAHGNSLRALIKELEGISDEDILALNIPYALPIMYEINAQGSVESKRFLADEETRKALEEEVKNQGKA